MQPRSWLLAAVSLIFLGSQFIGSVGERRSIEAAEPRTPKYVFIFLADGAGIAHLELARLYSQHVHREGTVIPDKIMKEGHFGLITTHSADSLVTDSAASATALAVGCKTKNRAVGICADGSHPRSVLEIAREKGMRVGLVTNSTIYDASPAAFASHVSDRRLYRSIIDQYLKLEPDLLLGGGRDQFLPSHQEGGRRDDAQDMIALFKKKGYDTVSDRKELAGSKGQKVLGLFSLGEMSSVLERSQASEPSLLDMADSAIRLLQQGNSRGFALFVENEHIDTASHFSDAASNIHEMREFDRAVGLAYRFYQKHPRETLLLVTSDHETGGLHLIQNASTEGLKKLQSISISVRKATELLGKKPSPESVERVMGQHFKGFALLPEWRDALKKKKPLTPAFSNPPASILGAVVASQTGASWTTSGHTNQPVFVAALGVGAERFRGYQDNTDFARHLITLIQGKKSP